MLWVEVLGKVPSPFAVFTDHHWRRMCGFCESAELALYLASCHHQGCSCWYWETAVSALLTHVGTKVPAQTSVMQSSSRDQPHSSMLVWSCSVILSGTRPANPWLSHANRPWACFQAASVSYGAWLGAGHQSVAARAPALPRAERYFGKSTLACPWEE